MRSNSRMAIHSSERPRRFAASAPLLLAALLSTGLVAMPAWHAPESGLAHAAAHTQPTSGATLYRDNCAPCHGAQAEGQVPGQAMGGQNKDGVYIAPALNGRGHMWHHAPDQIFDYVKRGSPAADSPMKGFAGRLSDDQIRSIIAHLQSLWPDRLQQGYRKRHHGRHN